MLGRLAQADLEEELRQADCLIVPSLCHENSPTIIAMARALGLRVVASRVGGTPEMVEATDLFPPGDASSLRQLLQLD